ncbi:MAG: XTP/dITP diphosphatase [Lachnospiraceae bacterium]|nr:XTP/dITP diphosphatase [Lachnospiraceae bacterium]
MGQRIIFATGNAGKMREIREILGDMGMEILSMKEAGIDADIVEDGTTFEENAVIKAKAVAQLLKESAGKEQDSVVVLADDSGLEIDFLNKEPGIYSARYMGEDTPFSVKSRNLIERLEGVPDEKRIARFVCAIAAVWPEGEVTVTRGVVEGRIDYEEKGDNGFGYDPIFYVPEFECTMAQLTDEQKNQISHRSKALEAMKEELKKRIT